MYIFHSFNRISNLLTERLLQDGWIDKIRTLTMEEINKNTKAGYNEILNKIEPKAIGMFDSIIRIDPCKNRIYISNKGKKKKEKRKDDPQFNMIYKYETWKDTRMKYISVILTELIIVIKKSFFFCVHIFIELLNAHVCTCYWKRNGIS